MKAGSATNNNSPAPNNPSTNTSTAAANANVTSSAQGGNSSSLGNSTAGAPNTTIGHYIIGTLIQKFILFLGKALGKGTFGQVKQATHILTGEKVC